MAPIRVAHFSDIHYTLSPWSDGWRCLRGKRLAGTFSYTLGGRGARFAGSAQRIAALLADLDAQNVDHAICTGDLTQVSREDEMVGVAGLFGARLAQPERFTVIPGNHDRYVREAVTERTFERAFASLCGGATFPFEKYAGGVRIVGIDPCRPTSLFSAAGLCGDAQRKALASMLARDVSTPTFVLQHYGLLRHTGAPDRASHGMIDAAQVQAIVDDSPAQIVAVLHGHMHKAFTVPTRTRTVIGAGSATDLHVACGYFVYTLDGGKLSVERRVWNAERGAYEATDTTAFNVAIAARHGALFAAGVNHGESARVS